jgi:hypothetical protein
MTVFGDAEGLQRGRLTMGIVAVARLALKVAAGLGATENRLR